VVCVISHLHNHLFRVCHLLGEKSALVRIDSSDLNQDLLMDWSLFQPRAKRFLLRDELGYSNHIYVSPIDRNPRESVCV